MSDTPTAIYVQWSDDGQHIRKWSHDPFDGSAAFVDADELTALRTQVSELRADLEVACGALETILGGGKAGTWTELVEPLVARFDVAANFGGNAVHNPDGSAALAELFREMASRLDKSVESATATLNTIRKDG